MIAFLSKALILNLSSDNEFLFSIDIDEIVTVREVLCNSVMIGNNYKMFYQNFPYTNRESNF